LLVVDWAGGTYRNEEELRKIEQMYDFSFDQNVKLLAPPVLAEHISLVDGERRVMVLVEILIKPLAVRVAPAGLPRAN
jgi:hypothetical protein